MDEFAVSIISLAVETPSETSGAVRPLKVALVLVRSLY